MKKLGHVFSDKKMTTKAKSIQIFMMMKYQKKLFIVFVCQ